MALREGRDAAADRGRFITFEGIDGAGKSTHVAWLRKLIEQQGRTVVSTREPGGTPFGETLRQLLLHETMTHESEALLMFAARREHVVQVIAPALARGAWVLCDRFTDATYAYQCGGHGVAQEHIAALERLVHPGLQPDLTVLFDVPTRVSRQRLNRAQDKGRDLDKFEREEGAFFERVRDTYLVRAAASPGRFRVIDSTQPLPAVQAKLADCVLALCRK